MVVKILRLALVFGLTGLAALTAQAQTVRYITDDFQVTLRTGESTQNQIMRMLHSGTRLELLETDSKTGYSQVRTADGQEGWVLTRYLVDIPSARDRLDAAQKKLANLELQSNKLNGQLGNLKDTNDTLEHKNKALTDKNRSLDQQLASIRKTAANALAIDKENKALKSKVVSLERKVQSLDQENAVLKDRHDRDWFIAGALVLIGGIILGLIIPRMRVRRKSNWDTL